MQVKPMPKRRQGVQAGKCKQCIRQIAVDIFGRREYGPIFFDAEVEVKEPKVEDPAVVNERDNPDDGDHEHEHIKGQVYRVRESPRHCADGIRQLRWRVPGAPDKP